MKTVYLNIKTNNGVETIEEYSLEEFKSYKEFREEIRKNIREHHLSGLPVYESQRASKEWREK